jgi:hypothetical protein
MKKLISVFFLILGIGMLYSQEIKFETIEDLESKFIYSLYGASDNDGNTIISYYNKEKIHYHIFDNQGELKQYSNISKLNSTLAGINYTDSTF